MPSLSEFFIVTPQRKSEVINLYHEGMKILFCCDRFLDSGGIQTMVEHMIADYESRGIRSAVLTTRNFGIKRRTAARLYFLDHHNDRIPWKAYLKRILRARRNSKKIKYAIKEFKPDLIHIHLGPLLDHSFHPLNDTHHQKVLSIHSIINDGQFAHRQEKSFISTMIGRNPHITCVSRDAYESLQEFLTPKKKAEIIPNGIPVGIPETRFMRKKNQILFAGRLSPEKGIDILLNAVRSIKDINVLIAGSGPEHKKYARVPQTGPIRFLGDLDNREIQKLMWQSSMFVMPSRYEGMPMALLEAMACSCPVIATAVGGVPEVIEDHKSGLLVPPEDPDALARAIEKLLADAQLRELLAKNAYKIVAKHYSFGRTSKSFLQLYKRILQADDKIYDLNKNTSRAV